MNKFDEALKKFGENLAANTAQVGTNLGVALIKGELELPKPEYEKFIVSLYEAGFLKSDLILARLIARGDIDPTFFLCGVGSSKLLWLERDKSAQRRLLGGEKFPVVTNDGTTAFKTWAEMNHVERNRLLGPRGGIRTIEEQSKKRPYVHYVARENRS